MDHDDLRCRNLLPEIKDKVLETKKVGESNSFPTYEEFFSKKTDDSRRVKL